MTKKYFSRKIKALTVDKQENLQAPLFSELSDEETDRVVGGLGDSTATNPAVVQHLETRLTALEKRVESVLKRKNGG
ncbi:MAG: hypothetical protein V7L29_23195 [Nostoc sp.]|uniref:hypothetical protein n=1 Tax=Nostoc sp. TaxID=1180 RepID=UPI002FF84DE7